MSESILEQTEKLKEISDNALESAGQGFAFPVSEKIRNLQENDAVDTGTGGPIAKKEILKTTLSAVKSAWETAIKPRIDDVRAQTLRQDQVKGGNDFFTEADLASEKTVKESVFKSFGENNVRVFGEEANAYVGNTDSRFGVRIDPVDGTESMKYGKTQDWSIMAGGYEGDLSKEKQIVGVMYFPEREMLVYQVDSVEGVFILNIATGDTTEISSLTEQNEISGIITSYWKHTNLDKRGKIDGIEKALREEGARLRSCNSASADVFEALSTGGQRAIVMDGDITTVDYIAYSFLQKLGYKLYDWEGNLMDTDDVGLTDKKMVLVPPGKAGEEIVQIVKSVHN